MRCSKCGVRNDEDSKYCENCGERLDDYEEEPRRDRRREIHREPERHMKRHVEYEHDYAGFWIRFFAKLIDSVILGVFNSILGFILFLVLAGVAVASVDYTELSQTAGVAMFYLVISILGLINLLYFIILDGTGGTLGKRMLRLEVINEDGDYIGIGKAFIRYFIYSLIQIIPFIGTIVCLVGYLAIAWDPQKQGWHDKMAGSFVAYR